MRVASATDDAHSKRLPQGWPWVAALLGLLVLIAAGIVVWAFSASDGANPTSPAASEEQPEVNGALEEPEPNTELGTDADSGSEAETIDCASLIAASDTGTCEGDRGATYEVVYLDHILTMQSQEAAIRSITTHDEVGVGSFTKRANGTFVVIDLAVTNRLSVPKAFDPLADDTYLTVEGDFVNLGAPALAGAYSQAFGAANNPGTGSFVWQNRPIQPNETRNGTVIFDVPADVAEEVTAEDTDSAILIGELSRPERPPFGGIVLREQT